MPLPGYYGDERDNALNVGIDLASGKDRTIYNTTVPRACIEQAAQSCLPAPPHQGLRRLLKVRLPSRNPIPWNGEFDTVEVINTIDVEVVSIERAGKLVWIAADSICL